MHNMRDLPALDLLKSFEAAARHLSFTRAGDELFLSQSAISRQIGMLEAQLGVQLFHRRVRSLLLTEAGQSYYRDISPLLQKLREVTARLSRPQPDGAVTVTTTLTFSSLWLVPRLSDFQRRHPAVPVRLAADNAIRDLEKSELDIAIRYSTRHSAGKGAARLFGERVMPVCSPALLAGRTLSKPEDLERFTLLHFQDPAGQGPWLSWNVWYEVMGMRPPAGGASLRFSHYDQLIRLVISPMAAKRPNVQTFAQWLRECVAAEVAAESAGY